MRIPDIKNSPEKVQLSRISHVYFEHADLNKFEKFAQDFGFIKAEQTADTIYFRGYGVDPYVYVARKSRNGSSKFMGAAFVAASEAEFDKATKIPGAQVSSLEHAPGGGKMVTLARPNGTYMYVVYGQEERDVDKDKPVPTETHETQGPFNTPFEKPRLGRFQRFHSGPALVHKLGHYGYVLDNFDEEVTFYTSTFNFVPSDILASPADPSIDILAFLHLDLGESYSDHHSLFLSRSDDPSVQIDRSYLHHSSYEVHDFDTQLLGHGHLAAQGWKSVWGVGRHVLGSQIFDYWSDPSGFKIEHYADGDMVNQSIPTKRDTAGPLSVWGPEFPRDFFEDGSKVADVAGEAEIVGFAS